MRSLVLSIVFLLFVACSDTGGNGGGGTNTKNNDIIGVWSLENTDCGYCFPYIVIDADFTGKIVHYGWSGAGRPVSVGVFSWERDGNFLCTRGYFSSLQCDEIQIQNNFLYYLGTRYQRIDKLPEEIAELFD